MTYYSPDQLEAGWYEHERQRENVEAECRAMLAAANAYSDAIAEPGIPEALKYVTATATAAAFISTAPATIPAAILSGVAIAMTGLLATGATAYSVQALERLFPTFGSHYSNAGEDFDKTFHFDTPPKTTPSDFGRDYAEGRAWDAFWERLKPGSRATGTPSLPDKDLADRLKERAWKCIEDNRPNMTPGPQGPTIGPARSTKEKAKPPAKQKGPTLLPLTDRDEDRMRVTGEGRSYAGPDDNGNFKNYV